MRLIDVDELKEHKFVSIKCYLKSNCDNGFSQYKQGWNDAIDAIIDNAPTVEPCYQTRSCLDCNLYDKENHYCPRFCEVIRELVKEVEERPTVELTSDIRWTDKVSVTSNGDIIDFNGRILGHINLNSVKSGADMRKEEENEHL